VQYSAFSIIKFGRVALSSMSRTKIQQPVAVDQWKLNQIRNLVEGGYSAEEISDQVDVDVIVIREIIELAYGTKRNSNSSENQ
jgi:hypothetical protein